MLSSEYRKLLNQDIPIEDKRLIHYGCRECNGQFQAISVLFGRPTSPICPQCHGVLSIKRSKRIPFYQPLENDYFLRAGALTPISSQFFAEVIVPLLSVPILSTPLFLIPMRPDEKTVHIVQQFDGISPVTYCQLIMEGPKRWRVCSGLTNHILLNVVCTVCHDNAITNYNDQGHLNPDYVITVQQKGERYRKLFQDVLLLRNVRQACELNEVCRTTFYNARKDFPQLYNQVMN
jgi:hypothetical protein